MNTRRKIEGSARPVVPRAMPDSEELRRRTAEKAYALYLRRNRVPGHELEDWLEAERLVREEMAPQGKRAPGRPHTFPTV